MHFIISLRKIVKIFKSYLSSDINQYVLELEISTSSIW